MTNDEPTPEGDSARSEEQESAQPATVSEARAEAADSASPQEAPPSAPINGEVPPESPERGEPDTESESAATQSGPAETDQPAPSLFVDFDEQMLELERARDAQGNIDTRPPDAETVTFRSVTVAEIYIGPAAESLTTALEAIEWVNFDEPPSRRIAEARKNDQRSSGNFTLLSDRPEGTLDRCGVTGLPPGIDRIYCEYYVIGPSIVAMVLTFVLGADDAKRIDVALREDVQSRLDRQGKWSSRRTVRDVKRERIRGVQDEVIRRCLEWLNSRMPGISSGATEGFRPPTCALLSLAIGKPFDTPADYMTLLGLRRQPIVMRFVRRDFLFLVYPLDGSVQVAAFNESDADESGWLRDPQYAPELFHEQISSLMIADGLIAALRSFEPRLRSIRADLNHLDISEQAGTQVIGLRDQLLGLSREISTVCGEVTVFVDGALMVWADFSPLVPVRPVGDSAPSLEITADRKRQQLRTVVQSLQSQEADLRELTLVTSQSMSETRNLELQTQVLSLTNTLNGLTKWLIVLTIVLVGLGVATLAVQLANTPSVTVHVTVTPAPQVGSHPASATPQPSPIPTSSASKTKALGLAP